MKFCGLIFAIVAVAILVCADAAKKKLTTRIVFKDSYRNKIGELMFQKGLTKNPEFVVSYSRGDLVFEIKKLDLTAAESLNDIHEPAYLIPGKNVVLESDKEGYGIDVFRTLGDSKRGAGNVYEIEIVDVNQASEAIVLRPILKGETPKNATFKKDKKGRISMFMKKKSKVFMNKDNEGHLVKSADDPDVIRRGGGVKSRFDEFQKLGGNVAFVGSQAKGAKSKRLGNIVSLPSREHLDEKFKKDFRGNRKKFLARRAQEADQRYSDEDAIREGESSEEFTKANPPTRRRSPARGFGISTTPEELQQTRQSLKHVN